MKATITLVEKTIVIFFFLSFLVFLGKNLLFVKVYTWNVFQFVLLYFAVIRFFYAKQEPFLIEPILVSILLIVISLSISTVFSTHSHDQIPVMLNFFLSLANVLYFRHRWNSVINIKTFLLLIAALSFVESTVGIIQQITNSKIFCLPFYFGLSQEELSGFAGSTFSVSRVVGLSTHPNPVACRLVLYFPFIVYSKYVFRDIRYNAFRNLLLILNLACLLFTFSRFAIFVWAVSVAFIAWTFPKRPKEVTRRVPKSVTSRAFLVIASSLIIVTTLGFIATSIDVGALIDRFEDRIDDLMTPNRYYGGFTDSENRLLLIRGGLQALLNHIFIGMGFRNSPYLWSETNIPYMSHYLEIHPHNGYLVMGVEGGLFCLLGYILLTVYPIYYMATSYKRRDPLLNAFLCAVGSFVLIQQMYVSPLYNQQFPLYMTVLGCAMGYTDRLKATKPMAVKREHILSLRKES